MTSFKNLEKELTSGGWLHFKSFKVLTGNSGKEICDMRPRTFLLIFLKKKACLYKWLAQNAGDPIYI